MIFRQILLACSIRNVWRTVRRIYIFISGLKGLITTSSLDAVELTIQESDETLEGAVGGEIECHASQEQTDLESDSKGDL